MSARVAALICTWSLVAAGCAVAPPAPVTDAQPQSLQPAPARLELPRSEPEPARVVIDSPPHEPVAPPGQSQAAPAAEPAAPPPEPIVQPSPMPAPAPAPVEPVAQPPAPTLVTTIVVASEPTPEEKEFAALLVDLQRYSAMNPEDLRREQQSVTQAMSRSRSDAIRIRLAVLYTHSRQTPQDDQRALQLFESVTKGNPGSGSLRQLAVILSAQVSERVRAVRDEQSKSDAALQKLEALRAMERSLLRDRVRSGGGGSGAGSGGSN